MPRLSEYPRPSHTLIQLSDTHFLAHDHPDRERPERRLGDVLAAVEASGVRPSAVLVTGDLTDTGDPDAYVRLRAAVEPVAARMGASLLWVIGNHDDRGAMRRELLDAPGAAPVDYVVDLDGLRVVVLDSTIPAFHGGAVTPDQLGWLAEVLAVPAPAGTILAMHHPPIPPLPDIAAAYELADQAALAGVLRGTDVRLILAGHLHLVVAATFAGIPVTTATSTSHCVDLQAPLETCRVVDGMQGYGLVQVYPDTVVHAHVPVGGYPLRHNLDAAATTAELAAYKVTLRA